MKFFSKIVIKAFLFYMPVAYAAPVDYSMTNPEVVKRLESINSFNTKTQRALQLARFCEYESPQISALEKAMALTYKVPELLQEDMLSVSAKDVKEPSLNRQEFVSISQESLKKDWVVYSEKVLLKIDKQKWCSANSLASIDTTVIKLFDSININHRIAWLGKYKPFLDKQSVRLPAPRFLLN